MSATSVASTLTSVQTLADTKLDTLLKDQQLILKGMKGSQLHVAAYAEHNPEWHGDTACMTLPQGEDEYFNITFDKEAFKHDTGIILPNDMTQAAVDAATLAIIHFDETAANPCNSTISFFQGLTDREYATTLLLIICETRRD